VVESSYTHNWLQFSWSYSDLDLRLVLEQAVRLRRQEKPQCMFPAGGHELTSDPAKAVWGDDGHRGDRCLAYPGCQPLGVHESSTAYICRCGQGFLLKIAKASYKAQCSLGDAFQATWKMRDHPCFEKLADESEAPPVVDVIVARRLLRVKFVKGCQDLSPETCSLGRPQLSAFGNRNTCERVLDTLAAGAWRLSGHDAWHRNYLIPEHTDVVHPNFWPEAPQHAGCPMVVIDLAEYNSWHESMDGIFATGSWQVWLPASPLQTDFERQSCFIMQRVFPCDVWLKQCRPCALGNTSYMHVINGTYCKTSGSTDLQKSSRAQHIC
jgi:hypothetical protein